MRTKTLLAAAAVSMALVAPAAPALASSDHHPKPAAASHGHGKADNKDHKKGHAKFTAHGTVSAVDASAGTLTFVVQGGKYKALRGQALTVSVVADARIQRNDATATLAEVLVNDRVHVKGLKVVGGMWTVSRVSAEDPTFVGSDD